METGYIYRFYNKITKKSYIGQTTRPLNKRVSEHLKLAKTGSKFYFHCALAKYGIENFEISILHTVDGKDKQDLINKLNVLEIKEIENYNSFYDGYNSNTGGDSYIVSDMSKKKMSNACKGRKFSEEHRKKLSEIKKGCKNPHSEEWCKKISQSLKKKGCDWLHTPEMQEKCRLAHIGLKRSEETKKKMSEAQKGRKVSDECKEKLRQINLGKKHSEETKKKLSEISKQAWVKRKEEMKLRKLNNNVEQLKGEI